MTPEQYGRHSADNIFKCIFLNEIVLKISLKFFPSGAVDYKTALVQVMAWHTVAKPLPEPMLSQFTGFNESQPVFVCAGTCYRHTIR